MLKLVQRRVQKKKPSSFFEVTDFSFGE